MALLIGAASPPRSLEVAVQGNAKERWFELCEQAATEQDAAKLYALVQEISRLLEEKRLRLNREAEAQRNSPCESGTRKKERAS